MQLVQFPIRSGVTANSSGFYLFTKIHRLCTWIQIRREHHTLNAGSQRNPKAPLLTCIISRSALRCYVHVLKAENVFCALCQLWPRSLQAPGRPALTVLPYWQKDIKLVHTTTVMAELLLKHITYIDAKLLIIIYVATYSEAASRFKLPNCLQWRRAPFWSVECARENRSSSYLSGEI